MDAITGLKKDLRILNLESAYVSSSGRGRRRNQDRVLLESSWFAVADGVGQRPGGDAAAEVAIDTLWSFATYASQADLDAVLQIANRAILNMATGDRLLRNAATTMTVVRMETVESEMFACVAHVGDSRLYLVRNGRFSQITDDHASAVTHYASMPRSAEPMPVRGARRELTRALGMSPTLDVAIQRVPLQIDDRLVLCTDGVTDRLSADDLRRIASLSDQADDLAGRLVWSALSSGGDGDATAIVIDVDRPAVKRVRTQAPSGSGMGRLVAA